MCPGQRPKADFDSQIALRTRIMTYAAQSRVSPTVPHSRATDPGAAELGPTNKITNACDVARDILFAAAVLRCSH